MSKGSLFWANASGKLGEVVNYRAGGEQRARQYVKKIKNPRTEAQVRNRIMLPNWTAMYRRLKPILEKTFTNKPTNESGFNALVRENKSTLRYAINKSMMQQCDYIPVGAKIASGSIVCNVQPKVVEWSDPSASASIPEYYVQLLALDAVQVEFPVGEAVNMNLTGKMLYSMLTENGNPMQLPSDFKVITFFGAVDIDDKTGQFAGGGMPLSYRVYTCNPTDETEGVFVGNADYQAYTKMQANVFSIVSSENGQPTIAVADGLLIGPGRNTPTSGEDECFGIVIYYETSQGKNANNAFIYGRSGAIEYAKDFSEGGDIFDEILSETGYDASSILSGSSKVKKVDFEPYTVLNEFQETED